MSRFWWFVRGHIFSNIFALIAVLPISFILGFLGITNDVVLFMVSLALYLFCFIKIYPKYFKYKTKEEKMKEAQEAMKKQRESGILIIEKGGIMVPHVAIDIHQRTFIHGDGVYPLDSIRSWNELTMTNQTGYEEHYLELHFKEIGYPYTKLRFYSKMTLKSTMEALQQVINEGKTTV